MKALLNIVLIALTCTSVMAQNVYEIAISSYANARTLNDVKFELYHNNEKVIEQESRTGGFQFVIKEGEGYFRLKATSKGFIPKVIHFPSDNYPFINEYEIQDIDIEFHKETKPGDESEIGELRWLSAGYKFTVVHVDSTMEEAKRNYATTEKNMGKIYSKAIEDGDELMSLNQPKFAMMHFETALLAKPGDEYAISKINEIKTMKVSSAEPMKKLDEGTMDKINKGEIEANIPKIEGAVFSVQLGAFSSKVSPSDFPGIETFIIEYEDYTRVFSGEFQNPGDAVIRKNLVVSKGYKDAWIVQMKGNQRIDF